VEEWERQGRVPDEAYRKFGRDGFIVPMACGSSIPREFSHYPIVAGMKVEEWNGFHDLVMWDEIFRGAPSISSAFIGLLVSWTHRKPRAPLMELSRSLELLPSKCMRRLLYKPSK
jgi:hypothetical protein